VRDWHWVKWSLAAVLAAIIFLVGKYTSVISILGEPDVLLQQVINGLSLGAMYALLAIGFTLVYGIMELINFAHFNVFMIGSFLGMWALEFLGLSGQSQVLTGLALCGALAFAFAAAMLGSGVLGMAIERIALRPLRGIPGTTGMITTIGVSYILFNIILLTAGADAKNYPNPMPNLRWQVAGAVVDLREVLIWGISLTLMAGLQLFVSRTRLGKAMRATAQDSEAARMMGIDVDRVIATAFFLGSALAGAAALIFGSGWHRQHHRRDGRRRHHRADRDIGRAVDRGALDRRHHLFDPRVGARLCPDRSVRPRRADQILIATDDRSGRRKSRRDRPASGTGRVGVAGIARYGDGSDPLDRHRRGAVGGVAVPAADPQ